MPREIVIRPGRSFAGYWRDVWEYRELFYFLAWRDILVRYKQTIVGVGWAVLRPLASLVVFTLVFGKLAKLPSDGAPYPLLVLAGLLPWQFFSGALTESGASLLNNSNLISKIYFPRMIVPASAVITSFVDFLIALILLAVLMAWYPYAPDWRILAVPLFALGALVAALAAGLWAAALTVRFRDFRIVIPFLVQLGFFISPVGYSGAIVPERWRLLYSLNPMAGIIDGFRWAVLGQALYAPGLLVSLAVTIALLLSGIGYFRKAEREFADWI